MNSVNPSIISENSDKIKKNNFTLSNNHTIDKSDPDSNTHKFLLNTIKSNKISNGAVFILPAIKHKKNILTDSIKSNPLQLSLNKISQSAQRKNNFKRYNLNSLCSIPEIKKNDVKSSKTIDSYSIKNISISNTLQNTINKINNPTSSFTNILKNNRIQIEKAEDSVNTINTNIINSESKDSSKSPNIKKSSIFNISTNLSTCTNMRVNSKFISNISREKIFYYVILPGNNSELLKKCMEHRINWKESQTTNISTSYHFKWQAISNGIDFSCLSKIPTSFQIVNHLENHKCISNKLNLFLNLMTFCEKRNLEVFNFIPFSLMIQFDSPCFVGQFENFTEFYNKIKDNLNTKVNQNLMHKSSDVIIENNNIYRKYSSMFKLGIQNEKIGYKTSCFIPSSHLNGKNIWLVKATNLNRGRCIKIGESIDELKNIIKKFYQGIFRNFKESENQQEESGQLMKNNKNIKSNSPSPSRKIKSDKFDFKKYRTSCMLLQKYIEQPMLYKKRKFDIRIWVLYTHKDTVYFFREGHLKTSSIPYDVYNTDSYVHLTNYSVQKYNKEFSKYEEGNEVSFDDFQTYLNIEFERKINIERDILPKIKNLIKLVFHSVKFKINENNRKYCFEIYGLDFILDKNFDVFLLEVNTNPGLEESSALIKKLLPRMIDDALRLTIDNLFETKYSDEVDRFKNFYSSPFDVDGYASSENLWELVTDFSDYYDY